MAIRKSWRKLSFSLAMAFLMMSLSSSVQGIEYSLSGLQRQQHTQQYRMDRKLDEASSGSRVRFGSFQLLLAKTPSSLTGDNVDDLFRILQDVIRAYMEQKLLEAPESTSLSYVFLADVNARTRNEQTTLSFPLGGVAKFTGGPTPSTAQVELWVEEAIEQTLVDALQGTVFDGIEYAIYISGKTSDSDNDSTVVSGTRGELESSGSDDDSPVAVIVGSAAGVLVVAALLAAYVRRNPKHKDNLVPVTSGSLSSHSNPNSPSARDFAVEYDGDNAFSARRQPLGDSASIAESESSFTVNTEAGDSMALKSLPTTAQAQDFVASESFERDLRVSLRKDMLTSAWIEQAPGSGRAAQQESVLAPSHFSASQERMTRTNDTENWNGEDESCDPSLRFESAHAIGEDAFLEAPSRVSSLRDSILREDSDIV